MPEGPGKLERTIGLRVSRKTKLGKQEKKGRNLEDMVTWGTRRT